jgi:hypothetical protein
MHPFVALGLLVAYFMLSAEIYLATHSVGVFRMSFFKIGPTELRILLSIGNLVLLVHPTSHLFGRDYRLFDVGGGVAIVSLLVTLVISVIRNTWTLYVAEPIPQTSQASAPDTTSQRVSVSRRVRPAHQMVKVQ